MEILKKTSPPEEVPPSIKTHPEISPERDPEEPALPAEPDFIPDEDPFETPAPYEPPPPGERP
ncbi:MAG: hypothetical protein JNK79_02060 [Chitinophagaceae bacterium]|nr:hypothetical protein [Chitinophagaceae bacterium]